MVCSVDPYLVCVCVYVRAHAIHCRCRSGRRTYELCINILCLHSLGGYVRCMRMMRPLHSKITKYNVFWWRCLRTPGTRPRTMYMLNVFDIFAVFSFVWQAPHMSWGTLNHFLYQMRTRLSQAKQEKILSNSLYQRSFSSSWPFIFHVRWWAVECRVDIWWYLLRRNFYCRFNSKLKMKTS